MTATATRRRTRTDISQINDVRTLRARLKELTEISVKTVKEMAAIVCRLSELGEDVSGINDHDILLAIGHGELLAEVYYAFAGNPRLLSTARTQPKVNQERLASNRPLRVVTANGNIDLVQPTQLTASEIAQVLPTGAIRSASKQKIWLAEQEAAKSKSKYTRKTATVAEFETLRDENNLLKAENTQLKARISTLEELVSVLKSK